ncbi:hypothetical protein [Burkholderia cenocepacia]|uniref:hypothetical protein n=1 Tax=Burkholderia cenocepacia TaxID=95486 RepID=UPI000761848C|nr:hypothetical protein [Burkholderia cenocepacia]KWU26401.1 hypothetical protein AS149_25780 [Burkholderia cenocepacia]
MKVEVWKSERTGEFFESEVAYEAHMASFLDADAKELVALDKRERLRLLQEHPFTYASSVDNLFERIIEGYPAVAKLMVELALLHPSAAQRKLVKVQRPETEGHDEMVLGPIGDVLVEFGGALCDTTLGFHGKRTFVYEGPDSEGLVDEMVKAFPKLRAGLGLGEGEARVSSSDGLSFATSFVCVLLRDVPVLDTLHSEYAQAWSKEGEALECEQVEVYNRLSRNDSAIPGIADEIRNLSAQIDQLLGWRERKTYQLLAAKERLLMEAAEAVPRLRYLKALRKTLCLQ